MEKEKKSYSTPLKVILKIPPSKITKESFIGIVSYTLLDKEMFKRNIDLKEFCKSIFKYDPKEYLYNSRTLLLSHIIRLVYKSNDDEIHNLKSDFLSYFIKKFGLEKDEGIAKWLK